MRVMTGHEEVLSEDKKTKKLVPIFATIPNEPAKLSDFPAGTLHPKGIGKTGDDGMVGVVTADGKKFRVKDDRKAAK